MDIVQQNLLSPAILCYFLGMLTRVVKSDLDFTQPVSKFLSLYLLFTIGFKGGTGLAIGGFGSTVVPTLLACTLLSAAVPVYVFFWMRKKVGVKNAAAVAATYGSVSAVTFIATLAYLDKMGIPYGSHMIAALALMESPAIVVGVLFARYFGKGDGSNTKTAWKPILKDAFLNGSILLLMGAMAIGYVTGEAGAAQLKPFTQDIFYGMLCLFLLDMGISTARNFGNFREIGFKTLAMGIAFPIVNSFIGMAVAAALGLDVGNALLVVVLTASASYIAVPAAMRLAIPEAKTSLYLLMSLAITFPFNIVIGIPLYHQALLTLGIGS